jgi:hypothetical protein
MMTTCLIFHGQRRAAGPFLRLPVATGRQWTFLHARCQGREGWSTQLEIAKHQAVRDRTFQGGEGHQTLRPGQFLSGPLWDGLGGACGVPYVIPGSMLSQRYSATAMLG